jgi:hypothetical protein
MRSGYLQRKENRDKKSQGGYPEARLSSFSISSKGRMRRQGAIANEIIESNLDERNEGIRPIGVHFRSPSPVIQASGLAGNQTMVNDPSNVEVTEP